MRRDLSKQFESGAKFFRDTNPKANINAFLAHWRRDLKLSQREARELYDEMIEAMEEMGLRIPDHTTFRELTKQIHDMPVPEDAQLKIK